MTLGDFDGNGLADIFRTVNGQWKIAYDGTGPWVKAKSSSAAFEKLAG